MLQGPDRIVKYLPCRSSRNFPTCAHLAVRLELLITACNAIQGRLVLT